MHCVFCSVSKGFAGGGGPVGQALLDILWFRVVTDGSGGLEPDESDARTEGIDAWKNDRLLLPPAIEYCKKAVEGVREGPEVTPTRIRGSLPDMPEFVILEEIGEKIERGG